MKEKLIEKFNQERPIYSQEECLWLLDHIGDEAGEIRDDLVYTSFARAIYEGHFTLEQMMLLADTIREQGLLFYKIEDRGSATLTRSFTALVLAAILAVDGNPESPYFNYLSDSSRSVFFEWSWTYLSREHDWTGYSEQYGWVHAVAHAADFLTEVVCHPQFHSQAWQEIFPVMSTLFHRVESRFIDDEELRLARVLYQAIFKGSLQTADFLTWLKQQNFPLETNADFYKLSNFRSFLLAIYFYLDKERVLSNSEKEQFQELLSEYVFKEKE